MYPSPQDGWQITRGGKTYGPYSWDQLVEHAAGGRITKRDKILDPRTGAWTKPTEISGLFGPGGAAVAPAGMTAAAKIAVGVVIGLALILGAGAYVVLIPPEHWVSAGQIISHDTRPAPDVSTGQGIPPEGLAYKGTFRWQSLEGEGIPNLWHDDECWLWIYTYEDGTAASFNYGEHAIDGWPVFLKAQSGTHYTFESGRSYVESVRIRVTADDAGMSGTVVTIDHIGSFVDGSFSGAPITYEQYRAEVID